MSNKEKTPEQIAAEEKAIAIIDSCEDCNHIASAISYLELFVKTFNDEKTYNELITLLKYKQKKLNCYAD
jgi:hypothetical protein